MISEKDFDVAFNMLERNTEPIYLVSPYVQKLASADFDRTYSIFTDISICTLRKGKRNGVKACIEVLKTLEDLCTDGETRIAATVDNWRALFSNKSSLREELENAGY